MSDLILENIHKSYRDVQVIHGIDMQIASGEFCVFVGPSGCGKSTLLRMIAGLEEVTAGVLKLGGEVINNIPAAKRGLAMVFQNYALYPHMSVRANLSFGLENLNMPKPEIDQRVDEAARMLQIGEYLDRRPGQLSGGQRQRVAIGRAVVREPRVFLFDEPLSNLDAELRVAMRIEISDLHSRLGNTMIYVTHDQVEAMTMADKIAVLRAGRLEQFGRPLDIFNAPANRFVAGFIGSPAMNFADGEIASDAIHLKTGETVPLPAGRFKPGSARSVTLGFRPSHLELSDTSDSLAFRVSDVEQLGVESFLYGTLSDDSPVTLHRPGQVNITRGDVIQVVPQPDHLHLFDAETGASLRHTTTQ